MDVFTAIRQRSSVRAYKTTDVEEDKLKKILEAARLSPSASNRQEWKFIVVKNKETKKKLANAAFGQSFIGEAPGHCCLRDGTKVNHGLRPTRSYGGCIHCLCVYDPTGLRTGFGNVLDRCFWGG